MILAEGGEDQRRHRPHGDHVRSDSLPHSFEVGGRERDLAHRRRGSCGLGRGATSTWTGATGSKVPNAEALRPRHGPGPPGRRCRITRRGVRWRAGLAPRGFPRSVGIVASSWVAPRGGWPGTSGPSAITLNTLINSAGREGHPGVLRLSHRPNACPACRNRRRVGASGRYDGRSFHPSDSTRWPHARSPGPRS
jgi:hypothetical protein